MRLIADELSTFGKTRMRGGTRVTSSSKMGNYNKLLKVFHPESEARISAERKAQLTAAFQIFSLGSG
jgi:hypothetical protein